MKATSGVCDPLTRRRLLAYSRREASLENKGYTLKRWRAAISQGNGQLRILDASDLIASTTSRASRSDNTKIGRAGTTN